MIDVMGQEKTLVTLQDGKDDADGDAGGTAGRP